MKKYLLKLSLVSLALCMSTAALADGVNIQLLGGASLTNLSGYQNIQMTSDGLTQGFATGGSTTFSPYMGLGVGYLWEHPTQKLPLAFNLGLTGYYLHNQINGTENPLTNGGFNADPVHYSADDYSSALMLEPKFIYNAFAWQPYFLAGIGVAKNDLRNFNQQQIEGSTSAPAANGNFSNQNTTNFAYEFGLGIQHMVYQSKSGAPMRMILGVEYRYMDMGSMSFGAAPQQPTNQGLTLPSLRTNMLGASLTWQF